MILAGDIGGTKTVLALFDEVSNGLELRREETFSSKSAATLERLARRFLDGSNRPSVRAACLGVAGAVVAGRVKATNLPWEIDEAALGAALGIPKVRLLNDLEAAAHGVLAAPAETFLTLQTGLHGRGPATMALIAAGTGLGEAIIAWDGTRHHVLASEGGHVDFAPRSELEAQLWEFLRREHGHVSYERVLSGPGFFNVYRFLRHLRKLEEPAWLAADIAAGDPTAAVSRAALARRDPVCVEALTLCVTIYGAEAGNLALKALAVGGVYVGGGIAPKILDLLREGPFMAGFLAKGRLTDLLRTIPVHLVRDPRAPLLGAAAVGASL
jgi:glucokinase